MSPFLLAAFIVVPIIILAAQIADLMATRKLHNKVEVVHETVNSNLSEAQEKLNAALVRIEHLEHELKSLNEQLS